MAAKISAPELKRRKSILYAGRLGEVAVGDADRRGQGVGLIADDDGLVGGLSRRGAEQRKSAGDRAKKHS